MGGGYGWRLWVEVMGGGYGGGYGWRLWWSLEMGLGAEARVRGIIDLGAVEEMEFLFLRGDSGFFVLLALVAAGELLLSFFLPLLFLLAFAEC